MADTEKYGNFNLKDLHCYGCAHSAAFDGFPGQPSGERPCCFCIRNPNREAHMQEARKLTESTGREWDVPMNPWTGHWYDGTSAISVPQDNYQTLDMKDQWRIWKSADQSDIGRILLCGYTTVLQGCIVACAKAKNHEGPCSWEDPLK